MAKELVESGADMVEIKVQSQGIFTVRLPKEMYDEGVDADIYSAEYKSLYSTIYD